MPAPDFENLQYVIGIGACAGGLEELGQLVAILPPELDSFLVMAQHMSASQRSLLAEILSRQPTFPLQEIVPIGMHAPHAEPASQQDTLFAVTDSPSKILTPRVMAPANTSSSSKLVRGQLKRPLVVNRVDEMADSRQEMQALNEELQASIQALQATNAELLSVNSDSQIISAELASINSDFESLYNTLDFPVLLLDKELVLKRANGAAMLSYDLSMASNGQPIMRLKLPSHLQLIEQRLQAVILSAGKEIFSEESNGRTYQIYISSVLSPSATVQGAVLVIIDNTDLTLAQLRTQESQQRLLSIMNHAMSLISVKDAAGCYEFVNHRFEMMFGLSASEVIGKTDDQLFGSQIGQLMRLGDLDVMRQLAAVESSDGIALAGGTLWLDCIRFPIFDVSGKLRSICTQANDVTHRRQADQQLRLAAKVFERSGEAILITDAHANILSINASFTRITGYAAEEVLGKNPSILKSGRTSPEFYQAMWFSLQEQGAWQGEIANRRKNGEVYPEWLTINAVKNDEGQVVNYVAIFGDITTLKISQQRIEFLATHDELTGLPNRSLLSDRLNQSLFHAKRQTGRLAVLFIDLDNFKNINDTLGHDVGDRLLIQATQRLQQCVRDADTLARIGGDEFVAVLTDIKLEEVNTVAGRIVDCLAASFLIGENRLHVSASIGISLFPDDGEDSISLLKNADTAMYRAKDRGRNQYQFFADEMKVVALQRMTLETGLRMALERDHLHMVYQPKIDLDSGLLIGAEALLRWEDPVLGAVSPAQFIPVAEGCGLIAAVGARVFDLVLQQIAAWRLQGLEVPRVAINVSTHQLRDADFVANLTARLGVNGVPAHGISIEITESALMQKIEVVRDKLMQLKAMGTHVSVDDFGTGYSSLAYLRKLPLNELKVDRSFVDGIAFEPDDRSIAKTIIDMAHALGFRVVAEGVETQDQLDILAQDGCDVVQGYLLHRPLNAEAFERLLQTPINSRHTEDAINRLPRPSH
jgi:two-component system CheB/CheR fusion protein